MKSRIAAVVRFSFVLKSHCITAVTVGEVSARIAPRTGVLYLFGDGTTLFESATNVWNKTDFYKQTWIFWVSNIIKAKYFILNCWPQRLWFCGMCCWFVDHFWYYRKLRCEKWFILYSGGEGKVISLFLSHFLLIFCFIIFMNFMNWFFKFKSFMLAHVELAGNSSGYHCIGTLKVYCNG